MSEEIEIDFSSLPTERAHCKCGCAGEDVGNVGGWCLWCDHVYRCSWLEPKKLWSYHYTDDADGIGEAVHFAMYCPGTPEELRQDALKRLNERPKALQNPS